MYIINGNYKEITRVYETASLQYQLLHVALQSYEIV